MTRRLRPPNTRRLTVGAVTAVATVAAALVVGPSAEAASASMTLVVSANQTFRPVTYVATGSLYGLADATNPSDSLAAAIKPNTFVQMAAGGRQQPTGDILVVAPKAARVGAKLVDRLSDYYPGWPYQFSWSTWPSFVDAQVRSVNRTTVPNLVAYEPWNESDQTWLSSNGTFEDFWTRTHRQIRAIDPTTPIQGPSLSNNISGMRTFLQNAVRPTPPDIISWHELRGHISSRTTSRRSWASRTAWVSARADRHRGIRLPPRSGSPVPWSVHAA